MSAADKPDTAGNLSTPEMILLHLKEQGPQTAAKLAEKLALTTMGVRQQLLKLQRQGVVENFFRKHHIGRPRQIWQLSAAGHRRFADRHAELSVQLITAVMESLGESALAKVVEARAQQQYQRYQQAMAGLTDLARRLQTLVALRCQDGYMARLLNQEDNSYLLVEDHCPICAAAEACPRLCQSELQLFRQLLPMARVERSAHLLAQAQRCSYQIIPLQQER